MLLDNNSYDESLNTDETAVIKQLIEWLTQE